MTEYVSLLHALEATKNATALLEVAQRRYDQGKDYETLICEAYDEISIAEKEIAIIRGMRE